MSSLSGLRTSLLRRSLTGPRESGSAVRVSSSSGRRASGRTPEGVWALLPAHVDCPGPQRQASLWSPALVPDARDQPARGCLLHVTPEEAQLAWGSTQLLSGQGSPVEHDGHTLTHRHMHTQCTARTPYHAHTHACTLTVLCTAHSPHYPLSHHAHATSHTETHPPQHAHVLYHTPMHTCSPYYAQARTLTHTRKHLLEGIGV